MHNVHVNQSGARRASRTRSRRLPSGATRLAGRRLLCATSIAIARLPAEQRAVLLLVTLEEMSYEEWARARHSDRQVMSRLSRAREKLA